MWFRTVSVLRCSSSAICAVERPRSRSSEHLALTRRQVQVRVRVRLLDEIGDLPEHADHVLATEHRHGAHLDGHPASVRADDRDAGVRDPLRADHLSSE